MLPIKTYYCIRSCIFFSVDSICLQNIPIPIKIATICITFLWLLFFRTAIHSFLRLFSILRIFRLLFSFFRILLLHLCCYGCLLFRSHILKSLLHFSLLLSLFYHFLCSLYLSHACLKTFHAYRIIRSFRRFPAFIFSYFCKCSSLIL